LSTGSDFGVPGIVRTQEPVDDGRRQAMGYSTDFLGHLDIEPPLNDEEIDYLTAFFDSRRCRREGGPYAVPGNPRAENLD
jgi:hypothetical protein